MALIKRVENPRVKVTFRLPEPLIYHIKQIVKDKTNKNEIDVTFISIVEDALKFLTIYKTEPCISYSNNGNVKRIEVRGDIEDFPKILDIVKWARAYKWENKPKRKYLNTRFDPDLHKILKEIVEDNKDITFTELIEASAIYYIDYYETYNIEQGIVDIEEHFRDLNYCIVTHTKFLDYYMIKKDN